MTFILFDGRAKAGVEFSDAASVLDVAETEAEAIQSGIEDWARHDAIWYECHEIEPGVLGPGHPRWDLPPASVSEQPSKKRRRRNKGQ